jgi:hypothetical protein
MITDNVWIVSGMGYNTGTVQLIQPSADRAGRWELLISKEL